jgi:hypothetical protein
MNGQFDDILLGSIELFCLAAEAGTFTGASTNASSLTYRAVAAEFPGYSTKRAARRRISWPATTLAQTTCLLA